MNKFEQLLSYKLIYVFKINLQSHQNLVKIGRASCYTTKKINELKPNCNELNKAAKDRINQYTATAGIEYELLHTELALTDKALRPFSDSDVHRVLKRSNVKNHYFNTEIKQNEWFKCNSELAKRAIEAVRFGHNSLINGLETQNQDPITFRPEQVDAISKTVKRFKKYHQMLWNAKMRFGKTLTALEVIKRLKFEKTIILTHRPVVIDSWFEDFYKIFYDTEYVFSSRDKGETLKKLIFRNAHFIYFASLQDLRGSNFVGGEYDKNQEIFSLNWDFVIIDEAHEGVETTLGKKVLEQIRESSPKIKILELSGTPFNLVSKYKDDEIFTWSYVMEQRAKSQWNVTRYGDTNPYENLPMLLIFTYDLNEKIRGFSDIEDKAFNFREFFRVWTGDLKKDFRPIPENAREGEFVHRNHVNSFLDLITTTDAYNNFPFSTKEYRELFKHTLWMVPGIKEAKALSDLLKNHSVFGKFQIINVAGEGDEEVDAKHALSSVKEAISQNPENTQTITISCGRLTTGVTVPEWTGVFMLSGGYKTSAISYLQTIFRVQSPGSIGGKTKEQCYVFDFAPDRTLKMIAEAVKISASASAALNDRKLLGEFLNFCPVIGFSGSKMKKYDVDQMFQQLKKAYADRVVKNGFDDYLIYNRLLLKLNEIELKEFINLKKIIGTSKQTKRLDDIDINVHGLSEEEHDTLPEENLKGKNPLSKLEIKLLEKKKAEAKQRKSAISILRGISIRIPLLIYGANISKNEDITSENLPNLIDDSSWIEFMPQGVTKEIYQKFSKYYDTDIFISAGRKIRNSVLAADELAPLERIKKITEIFATFRNPDKETVLTPWRVVNKHLSECIGGYSFFDQNFENQILSPQYVENSHISQQVFQNSKSKVLEINSKSGLYALYMAYSIYQKKCEAIDVDLILSDTYKNLWKETIENNIFLICKTKMAKLISQRTLIGYKKIKINSHWFEDLIGQLQHKPEIMTEKITRGSFWNREENKVKFDAVIGNPPYQNSDGGGGKGTSATPIYQYFVNQSFHMQPDFVSLIIPSRWFSGGKGLDKFRENMLSSTNIRKLVDFTNANDIFPGTQIKGGVCYFLWDQNYDGPCEVVQFDDGARSAQVKRYLNEYGTVFVRFNEATPILEKVLKKVNNFHDETVSSRKPFGILSNFKEYRETEFKNSIKLYSVDGIKFVNRSVVLTNKDWVDSWKTLIPKAGPGNDGYPHKILGQPIVAPPGTCATETYLVGDVFSSEQEAKNFNSYLHTKFARFMIALVKNTQNLTKSGFRFTPIMDYSQNWTDEELYKYFDLNKKEQAFITTIVKPMK